MKEKRLLEIIDNILAWGSEHNEEFRECLIHESSITEEEFQDMFHNETLKQYIEGDY